MKETNGKHSEEALNKQVGSLYEMMKSENLDELEIKEEDFYLFIRRKTADDHRQVVTQVLHGPAPVARAAAAPEPVKTEPAPAGLTVKSPIMGVFYQAPSPSSPVFVKEGDTVSAGKTLCIVEAMKVMNEIKAEFSLKVLKILVENGKPITSDQDLFLIEKI
ncbi:MAG TPA: acetyl-CoA carboxylase biotin carboxyl carrier protein [Elusimicrobia bacterium]|nr:MAG: acetyl-CoA carboxylase, biotin carboxyl carrier protein [Elusimicrobia bacterium RIFOXYA12_FULL_49_49]OGS11250.1 MAG: acetyl-CoA carboxylase, biotin carboxyl carrier protein [Elusimicrobia bacterium RIFOXYB1_FULL_48_9]OGS15647.1 MAG: acetyl-CoA carboxylase, biotin carboxyl carrier protein [Elusimicrobia bacterium RIFOXYA2_FULL_47_53]OGS26797.1 MAG: acetyl-CoA carboxylase, biotin carboxyl carrier protein [Elusimicrobia bacterium RIFOXYB12_FULL_50_12]OGS30746.1 MAG: acetyl-CoA carboxylase